jgi:hypothetical protein
LEEVERLEGLVRAARSMSFAPSARHSGGWDRCLISSRGDPPGRRRRGSAALLLAASARLYSALLVFYPKAFRQRTLQRCGGTSLSFCGKDSRRGL